MMTIHYKRRLFLSLSGISNKRLGGVHALRGSNLNELNNGKAYHLLGENGLWKKYVIKNYIWRRMIPTAGPGFI